MKNETKHICPHCGKEMELYDYDGYFKDTHDYDTEPEFVVIWEQYRCKECGELKDVFLENFKY